MKKSREKIETENSDQEGETLRRKIAAAKNKRSKLLAAVEENPSDENRKKLKRLDETIERDSDTLHLSMIAAVAPTAEYLIEMLPAVVGSQNEEELLELGDEAFAAQILTRLRAFRNQIFDSTMLLSNNETVKAFMRRVDEAIERGETQLEEKRLQAAADFPELARKFRPPDYEMPAEYTEMLQFLVEKTEQRDKAAKNLKYAAPNKRKEFQTLLAEADKIINEGEQKLAELYERHQQRELFLDNLRKFVAKGSKTEIYQLREYAKKNAGRFLALEKVLREDFPAGEDD